MKILVLGADGQLGSELRRSLAPLGELVMSTLSGQLPDGTACVPADFSKPASLEGLVERHAPDWVVNAAAYTAVDKAEDEPELARRINAEAVAVIARGCATVNAGMVHFSTDYVFAGDATRPYREDDAPGALGVYGASKWAGEEAVRHSGARHRIFRLCWVYGAFGHNFLKTMLRLAAEREELRVVADQVGTPTPAAWIAETTACCLPMDAVPSGTWHLAAGGQCSWFEFACAIIERAHARGMLARKPAMHAITTADFPTRARRPAFSTLATDKLARDFDVRLPAWQAGIERVLDDLQALR